jgi:uncharacterized repeat protein (TIGR01451 family)
LNTPPPVNKLFADRRATLRAIALLALAGAMAASGVVGGLDVPVAAQASRAWYVAPNGLPTNPGTQAAPFDLSTALAATSPVRPGETVWLRGGVYAGAFVSRLSGTASAPIVVRQLPGERAIIDSNPSLESALTVHGQYVWFWGFEIRNSERTRVTGAASTPIRRGAGVTSHAPGAKFINLIVHDMRIGIELWASSPNSEAYGNLIFHNGWAAPDRGHGHGIYAQNRDGVQQFTDNILFGGFSHGIHAYGSDAAYLNNIQLVGNTVFNSGVLSPYFVRNILLGGGRLAENPVVRENYTYFSADRRGGDNNLGYAAGCANLVAMNNYFAHPAQYPLVIPATCGSLVQQNTFVGFSDAVQLRNRFPVNSYFNPPPPGVRVFVRPNRYESGRANITVFNWDGLQSVDVSLAGVGLTAGDAFEIRDVQNIFGPPVVSGTYSGSAVRVPMDGAGVVAPIGNAPLPSPHTSRQFGAFIVARVSAATTAPAAPNLRAAITAAPATGTVGQTWAHDITITNRGTAAATGVQVNTTLTGSVQVGSRVPSQGSCVASGPVACGLGSLAAGASATIRIALTPGAAGAVIHEVVARAVEPDADPGDDRALLATSVAAAAAPPVTPPTLPPAIGGTDLRVTQHIGPPAAPVAGGPVPVGVTVTNGGTAPASAVSLTFNVKAGAWVVVGLSATTPGCVARDGSTFTCAIGTLAPGAARTFGWQVLTRLPGTLVTSAMATNSSPDLQPGNNAVAVSTPILAAGSAPPSPSQPPAPTPPPGGGAPADLVVTSALSHATVAGTPIVRARFSIRNQGGTAAPGVKLDTALRAQPWVITSASGAPSQGSCQGTYNVACSLGPLASGATAFVDVTLSVRLASTFSLVATATGAPADPTSANNAVALTGKTIP